MTQPGCYEALINLVSRIKQSANRAGIDSVRKMAIASGVSKSGIDKIYRLNSYPTFDTLLAMANACGVTVHDWTINLEQEAASKGKRPEKADDTVPAETPPEPDKAEKPNPIPEKPSKPAGKRTRRQRHKKGEPYKCFGKDCGKEYDTYKEVKACYASHKDLPETGSNVPMPKPEAKPEAKPIPETKPKAANEPDGFVDVLAMLKGNAKL